MRLSEIGEFGLIARVVAGGAAASDPYTLVGIGDDAAVMRYPVGHDTLVTTDMLVEGVHFRVDTISDKDLGYKAVAVSISDIAAMGGEPRHAFISLAIPKDFEVERIERMYEGIRDACTSHSMSVAGGDTVSSPNGLVITVTVIGTVEQGQALLRSTAVPGDIVAVTGPLGGSAGGLHLMMHGSMPAPPDETVYLLSAHRYPQPQVTAGRILRTSGACTACDDISDGLARELHEIASASRVGMRIDRDRIPIHPAVSNYGRRVGVDPLVWALQGGEDYELLFTVSPLLLTRVDAAFAAHGLKLYVIGTVTDSMEVTIRERDGMERPLPVGGYNHFPE